MNKPYDNSDEERLKTALLQLAESSEGPPEKLNRNLKHSIRIKEQNRRTGNPGIIFYLLPMFFNLIFFLLLSICLKLIIPISLLSKIASVSCFYFAVWGVLLTFIGMRYMDYKENFPAGFKKGEPIA